jgi:hypothetical protein
MKMTQGPHQRKFVYFMGHILWGSYIDRGDTRGEFAADVNDNNTVRKVRQHPQITYTLNIY